MDDGISGTKFQRRGFDALLSRIRSGEVNCIIVKDFSRFGRDHIEVGNYLEKIFPFLGVRFISVNDGYDSFDKDSGDKKLAVILKNLVNEYVAKDTSVKVASSYRLKQEKGEYDGGRAPYGYVFADERKTGFAIDEKAAQVVRDIFNWTMQGDSAAAIVKRLTERKINPPRAYYDTGSLFREGQERSYWSESGVNGILYNMAYAGHMALHKSRESKAEGVDSFRLDKTKWKIRKNTHEAIVMEEDFLFVQQILRARGERHKRVKVPNEEIIRPDNLLKGKVFCGDCLVPASRMGSNYERKKEVMPGKIRIYRYRCRTYREKGAGECTSKSTGEKELEELVYQAVLNFLYRAGQAGEQLLRLNDDFFRKLSGSVEKEKHMEQDAIRQEKSEKIRLYQKYAAGRRSGFNREQKERYFREKQKKEEEIFSYGKRIKELEEKAARYEQVKKEQEDEIRHPHLLKENNSGRATALTAVLQMVDKIFLYDGKRVEIMLNFREEIFG